MQVDSPTQSFSVIGRRQQPFPLTGKDFLGVQHLRPRDDLIDESSPRPPAQAAAVVSSTPQEWRQRGLSLLPRVSLH